MARLFYQVMQDNVGNLLFDVSGTMRVAGSATLATIYGDEALTVILPNPMTNHPSFGSFKCFLGVGDYDFHMAKAGYTFETLTGIQGYGTMAQQDAGAVAITGGSATALNPLSAGQDFSTVRDASIGRNLAVTGTLSVTSTSQFAGVVGIGVAPNASYSLSTAQGALLGGRLHLGGAPVGTLNVQTVRFNKGTQDGITLQTSTDSGGFATLAFLNAAGTQVGGITQTGAATAYNTSSDGRLKEALAPLSGALETLMRLLPRTFRWKSSGELGHGFVAEEVVQVVPGVTTGTPGAMHADGSIDPMQMDHSKLMPWVVAALQEVVQRLEAIEARLA